MMSGKVIVERATRAEAPQPDQPTVSEEHHP
jgi:hypothetical protein